MKLKYYTLDIWLVVSCCCLIGVKTQEDSQSRAGDIDSTATETSSTTTAILFSDPKELKNIQLNSSGLLVLLPSSINLTDSLLKNESFNLFKLDTDVLFDNDREKEEEKIDDISDTTLSPEDSSKEVVASSRISRQLSAEHRNARRFNLLRGLLSRPRSSPLYLINGTVCRFINSIPLCTTLSTTGLPRPPAGGSSGGSSSGGGSNTPRPNASGQSSSGSSVQFADPNRNQQPRPAAVMDDDSQDVNVENLSGTPQDTRVVRNQQQQQQLPQQAYVQQTSMRPTNFIVNRRPLNLLGPLRRPVRHYMISAGRATLENQNKPRQTQSVRGGRVPVSS